MALSRRERHAFHAAITQNLAATVRRVRYGAYLVPSTSTNLVYSITTDEHGCLRCSCPAGQHGHPCKHAAAVRLRKTQEDAKRQARRLLPSLPPAAWPTPLHRSAGNFSKPKGSPVVPVLNERQTARNGGTTCP
jgi:hypothetical protein